MQLEEEIESLKRQLADAQAREEQHRSEVQIAHSQTDSAVAQLRGMQERLDALEVCITTNTVYIVTMTETILFQTFVLIAWRRGCAASQPQGLSHFSLLYIMRCHHVPFRPMKARNIRAFL